MFNNPKTIEISDYAEVRSLEVTREEGKEEGEDASFFLHAVIQLKGDRPYDEHPDQLHMYSPHPLPFVVVPIPESEETSEEDTTEDSTTTGTRGRRRSSSKSEKTTEETKSSEPSSTTAETGLAPSL